MSLLPSQVGGDTSSPSPGSHSYVGLYTPRIWKCQASPYHTYPYIVTLPLACILIPCARSAGVTGSLVASSLSVDVTSPLHKNSWELSTTPLLVCERRQGAHKAREAECPVCFMPFQTSHAATTWAPLTIHTKKHRHITAPDRQVPAMYMAHRILGN